MLINLRHSISIPAFAALVLLPWCIFATPVIHTITPNGTSIAKYEKLELAITLSATYSNPYDYSQISLKGVFISPSGVQYFMDGFYFQDYEITAPNVLVASGPPGWRIRFSPNETGMWIYYASLTDASGTVFSTTQQFNCTASDRKGFVKKNGNKLVYSNGETFHSLGTNLAWQWWWDGWAIYEDWINALDENGGNFTKLTMAPWIFEIEWSETGVGQYTQRQNRAWVLDWVFEQLIEKDIYCMLNPMIHDVLQTNSWTGWGVNPYNQDNGGPCHEPQNFFVNETAILKYKQKLRYINARWGYSPQVAMWEQLSEADNTGLYDAFQSQTLSWLNIMTSYMNSIDAYNRPVSSAFAIPQHNPEYWGNYNTGFTQQHIYSLIPDLEMKIYNFSKSYMETWNKPFITGEFALSHDADQVNELDPQGIAFHNVVWSSVFSGSMGSAMSWYWDNYLYPNNLFDHLQAVSGFLDVTDVDVSQLQALVPLCTATDNDNIVVVPDYNNENGKAPENYFHHEPSGLMYPVEIYLGRYLYGSLYGARRNPPTFKVNYTRTGEFRVKTDNVAIFSKIKIKIDGATVFDQNVSANTTYSVPVTIGEHEIRVENSGSGILKIKHYEFFNYAPQLRTFALKNDDYAAGWMQNIKYNWQYLNQYGTPFPVSNGKIHLDFPNHGVFDVYWYNQDAEPDSVQRLFNADGGLELDAPGIVWDGAFEVKFVSPVEVHFSASPISGDAPLTVQFTDQSVNAGGAISAWNWDFGDGNTSNVQNPQHTYQTPGIYTVNLEIVSGQYSNALTRENYISVSQPLVADFIADTTFALPAEIIHFTDLSLGSPTSWLWAFGDNTVSFAKNPNHAYGQPGSYSVSLFVQKGSAGDIETKTNYIQILENLAADFSSDKNLATLNEIIQFTDLSTGNPTLWFWDFGDGTSSSLQNPAHSYNQPGTYNVKLSVTNAYFQDSTIKTDFIEILEPLTADFYADTLWSWTGQDIQFIDLSTGNPDARLWNFGDEAQSTIQNPVHAYPESGIYTVSLEISDALQTDVMIRENYIHVKDTLNADFTVDTTVVILNSRVYFTDQSAGSPLSWFWLFGDGFSSSLQNPFHKFKYAADFTIRLQISRNDSIDIEIKHNYIKVIPELVADFMADTLYAQPGEMIQFFDLSTGNPDTWIWDFGNNTNKSGQNPVTSYQFPGNYTITLQVFNQYLSDTLIRENYINILEPVLANFTVNPFEAKIGQEVQYIDLSTGFPNQWEWWMGNGDTAFVKNPVTIYNEPGLYDVTLIARSEMLTDTLTMTEFLYVMPPFYSQEIILRQGWSGISTWVRPVFPEISQIMNPVNGQLFFAINEEGIYSPGLNINTIGNWNTSQGLIVFMNEEASLTIEGYQKVNSPVELIQGWSLLPVFSACSHTTGQISDLLNGELKLIKEIGGFRIYWPEMGIFTLDSIEPGAMYQIYMNQSQQISFPACD
ncbi:MAG: PKD domain-containing protein [Bacteroidales bacterium]|nr:PKD domain-containing protein [Bacteroidales bacterium]